MFAAQFVQLAKEGIPICQHGGSSVRWAWAILSISAAKDEMPGANAMACNFSMEFARRSGLA
ncbi:hypothetical protein JCM25156A_21140 [Komagataeibacter kakiaceti JCM 25156]